MPVIHALPLISTWWLRMPISRSAGLGLCRRCQFPVEIGLYLQAPCRLQEIVVFSEPALAPSAVELFVAGPTRSKIEGEGRGGDKRSLGTFPRGIDQRHSGPTTVSGWFVDGISAGG